MLSTMEQTGIAFGLRRRDEQGTSLVEFALVVTLLCTLLLGIVVFGILLSKRQVLTQAAAEGARAAVPISYSTTATPPTTGNVTIVARTQVNKSLGAMDRNCSDGPGITDCTFVVYPCVGPTTIPPTGVGDCLDVTVSLKVSGSKPLAPSVSFISPFLPSQMSSTFTVTLANPS